MGKLILSSFLIINLMRGIRVNITRFFVIYFARGDRKSLVLPLYQFLGPARACVHAYIGKPEEFVLCVALLAFV